jgi:hypothetical protein
MTHSDPPCASPSVKVLKRDVLGRVISSAEQRRVLLEEFAGSGLSGPQFAQMAGVKYQTFATWRQLAARQHKTGAERPGVAAGSVERERQLAGFVELVAAGQQEVARTLPAALSLQQGALRVSLLGGATLWLQEGGQVALAVQLITALHGQTGGGVC